MATRELLDFEPATLPWLDRYHAEIDEYVSSLSELPEDYDLRSALHHWAQFGYAVFPAASADSTALMDAYLEDLEELFERRELGTTVIAEGGALKAIKDLAPEELDVAHLRVNDFHNASVAGKKLAMNSIVISFLSHVFQEPIVAMQSLTFVRGSEQAFHQDFAYVISQNPSHLAASWLALEDVHPDAGPLAYYPGSHMIRKFDWGDGLFRTPASTRNDREFAEHIVTECERMGLKQEIFTPKRGDIFVWHGTLAHGGGPVHDPSLTRKSLVTHFSSESAYQRDKRMPDAEPIRQELNGGVVFGHPHLIEEEDIMQRGAAL